MGFRIALQDEGGNAIDCIEDPGNALGAYLPRRDGHGRCLRYIDPYGDAVFNRLQMEEIIEELNEMSSTASREALPLLARISELARRGIAEPHLYLRFIGD